MGGKDGGFFVVSQLREMLAECFQLSLGRITGGEVMGRLLSRRPHGTFGYVGDKPLIQIDFPDDYAGGYGCSCISHGVFLPGCEPFLSIGSITSRMHAQIPWSALDATTRSAA